MMVQDTQKENSQQQTTREHKQGGQRETSLKLKTGKIQLPSSRLAPKGVTGELNPAQMNAGQDEPPEPKEGKVSQSDETVPDKSQVSVAFPKGTFDDRKPNILIIEDTAELAEVIQATLENKGMEVAWVSHGSKGLEKIEAKTPDIILLDIGLPDMTGWKVLEKLHKVKEKPEDIPTIIVITAYGDPANRLIGKLQGIHSYLIKPFTSDEVERVVQGALGRA